MFRLAAHSGLMLGMVLCLDVRASAQGSPAPEAEADAEADAASAADAEAEAEADADAAADAAAAAADAEAEAEATAEATAEAAAEAEPYDDEIELDDALDLSVEAVADVSVPDLAAASSSELHIEPGLLRAVPRPSAEALLTLVPSVFLVNHSGTYHASSVFLRGFDAGEGQDLEVLVDGVPLNEPSNAHGHGYADTHFVIPEVVRTVRASPGPFSPEQSDFAVAGSVEHELGVVDRGIRVGFDVGSFDSQRLMTVLAPHAMRDGTFLAVDLRRSSGFGTNRASLSAAAMGRLELEVARDLTFHVLLSGHFAEFGSAGVVSTRDVASGRLPCAADPDSQRFCTPDPNQGGASARGLLATGLHLRAPSSSLDVVLFGGYRSLRIRENFTGYLVDVRGDGLDEQYAVGILGFRGRYRSAFTVAARPQVLELGLVVRRHDGDSRMLRVRATDGVPHTAVFDDALHLTHIGAHAGLDLSFASELDARIAVRADAYALSATERAFASVDRMGERLPEASTDAFGVAVQPRATVRAHLYREGVAPDDGDATTPDVPARQLTWTTSFALGSRSADAIGLAAGERAPFAEVVATETGLSLEVLEGDLDLDARVAAFHTYVGNDLIFRPETGRNQSVGSSSRIGAQAYLRVKHQAWLDVSASFAWNEAFLLGEGSGSTWVNFVSSVRLPYVPRWVGRLDAAVSHPVELLGETFRLSAALGVGWLGERPLPLGGMSEQVVLADASASLGWRLFTVGVAIQNLFDARWASSVFDYEARWDPSLPSTGRADPQVAMGAPFSLMVQLAVAFDETDPLGEREVAAAPEPDPHAHVHSHPHAHVHLHEEAEEDAEGEEHLHDEALPHVHEDGTMHVHPEPTPHVHEGEAEPHDHDAHAAPFEDAAVAPPVDHEHAAAGDSEAEVAPPAPLPPSDPAADPSAPTEVTP